MRAALQALGGAGIPAVFPPETDDQVRSILRAWDPDTVAGSEADLREWLWSSIDNDTSRDLDQIEYAERVPGGIRLHVAIADVADLVAQNSVIDEHAEAQTQTVYTAVHNFPMLPLALSAGATSLLEEEDRAAVVMSFTVSATGEISDETVKRALVRNRAQMAYSRVGPWLDAVAGGKTPPAPVRLRSSAAEQDKRLLDRPTFAPWLTEQLQLQDEAARALHGARQRAGALDFQRAEADPVVMDGRVVDLQATLENRAMHLVEDLMIAANGVMARAMRSGGRSGLQRVVRTPRRWDRIVVLAQEHGGVLPATPDPVALNDFLTRQRAADPDGYPDLALAVIKLLGAGEYVLMRPEEEPLGHFGLAARDYAHSTAPNRRFPDLVTQRVLWAMEERAAPPYSDERLAAIAEHCNAMGKVLRKLERGMEKRVAALALQHRIGETFRGVVTGATPKGVYVRVFTPPFEGRVIRGEQGLDVGARINVRLLHTDVERAFIDLERV